MWIVLVEVREKVGVSEVKEARSIVRHYVGPSGDEETAGTVAVEALMSAGFVTQKRGCSRLGHCSFILASQSGGVVRSVFDSGVGEIVVGGHDA